MFNKLFGWDEPVSVEVMKHIALEDIDSKASVDSLLIARELIENMSDDDFTEAQWFN